MKELVVLCAVICCVRSGAVVWPGAVPLAASVRTVIPPHVKGFAYSTSQYINAVPPSYTIGYHPQVSYQIPQFGVYPAFPSVAYQPALAPTYYPGSSIIYPAPSPIAPPVGLAPIAPQPPVQGQPASPIPPSQDAAGDEDTAVVDSAEFASGQRGQQQGEANKFQPSYDSKNMPGYPQIQQFPIMPQYPQAAQRPDAPQRPEIPQIPQIPQVPQVPQIPGVPEVPQVPQVPQVPDIPQYPSGFPQYPQFPQPPQFQPNPPFIQSPSQNQPSVDQSGFPSSQTGTQNLNDEDTVAVESA